MLFQVLILLRGLENHFVCVSAQHNYNRNGMTIIISVLEVVLPVALHKSVELSSLQSFNKIKKEEEQHLVAVLCELWVRLEGYVRACLHTAKVHHADSPELKHPNIHLWPEIPKDYLLTKCSRSTWHMYQHVSYPE